jgi:hypothetical protein
LIIIKITVYVLAKILKILENDNDETFSNNNKGNIKNTEYNVNIRYLLDNIEFGKKYSNIGTAEFVTTVI